MLEEILDLTTPDGVMVKNLDGEGPFPVVLLFHDGPGVREATHSVVRRFADAGYYVVAPDRYHRHGRFVHVEPDALIAARPDSKLMQDFFKMVMSTTDDHVRDDVVALLDHLVSAPLAKQGEMGCVGYCNGARAVLRTMSEHPSRFVAGVGFHPSFCVSPDDDSPHLCVSNVKGHLYFAIGEADHTASVEHNRLLIDEHRPKSFSRPAYHRRSSASADGSLDEFTRSTASSTRGRSRTAKACATSPPP
jgi:carboxymethylenebutenolidase